MAWSDAARRAALEARRLKRRLFSAGAVMDRLDRWDNKDLNRRQASTYERARIRYIETRPLLKRAELRLKRLRRR